MSHTCTIPKEIEESAFIDGANRLQVYFRIALPLAIMIAYSTEDSAAEMARSSIIIYAWFSAVVLAAAGLVRVID